MKQLSIEDKAKRYEEVLAMAKEYVTYIPGDVANYIFNMFPELKESTDEGIRESIAGFLKTISSLKDGQTVSNEDFDTKVILEWVAWLKKQGKQSNEEPQVYETRDGEVITYSESKGYKVAEPKFKFGDWIIDKQGLVHQIENVVENVTNHTFGYDIVGGGYFNDNSDVRLWTIQDAKDGDVLHSPSHHLIWIYKNSVQYHACVNTNYAQYYDFDTNGWLGIPKDIFPATKDEQTILFERIKRAGYEWDEDKKELIKL